MKPPQWFREQLATEGRQVLQHTITDEEAVVRLAKFALNKADEDEPPFVHRVLADYVRRKLKNWLAQHRVAVEGEPDDQLDLFPDIPRTLEVAPGRFVAQAFMTRRDWTAAVKQADTKASNASGHAEAIKRIADKVLPLLTDDEQTTAEVWKPGGAAESGS